MEAILFLILAFSPLVCPWVVVGTAVQLVWRARHGQPPDGWTSPDAMSCALVVQLAGAAAVGAYAWGVMSGFYILDPDQMCAASGADGDHVVTRMTLPVSVQCVTDQGVGSELVPVWVNPVVFAGLAVCVLAVWAGVFAAIRRRADRARGEVEVGGGELRSGGVG